MFKTKSRILSVTTIFILILCCLPIMLVHADYPYTYSVYVDAYDNNHATSVAVAFSLDGSPQGNTPKTLSSLVYGVPYYLNIALTDSYGNNFQGWQYAGVTYIDNTFWLDYSMNGQTVTAIYSSGSSPGNGTGGTGNYIFYGLNNEDTGLQEGSVYVTAYYNIPGTFPQRFLVNGQYGYNTTVIPLYFSYDLGNQTTVATTFASGYTEGTTQQGTSTTTGYVGNETQSSTTTTTTTVSGNHWNSTTVTTTTSRIHREYWLSQNENSGTYYVFNGTSLANFVINFRDLTGALSSYDKCSIQRWINGSLVTVDKRKIDITHRVVMLAMENTLYNVVVSDGATYTFGDVNTLSNPIDLTLKGIEFPQSVIIANQYIRFWGYRTAGAITVNYQDTQGNTTDVSFQIKYTNGTVAYTSTPHINEFIFQETWAGAIDNVTYYLTATITTDFGTLTQALTLAGSLGGVSPWSLAFLGSFPLGVDSSQIIPSLAILFVFGLFSVLNAYLGAFFGTVMAAFFGYMGWLNINGGVIVAGLAFSIFLGITFAKRRLLT